MRKPMATILFIDDDDQMRMFFQIALEGAGHRVLTAENGRHGLRLAEQQEVDLALVDLFLPDMDGLEVIELLHMTRPACKIIAMSGGSWSGTSLDTATQLGANVILKKPFSLQELLDAVASHLN
jgi:CheY-like chemotaxis protein